MLRIIPRRNFEPLFIMMCLQLQKLVINTAADCQLFWRTNLIHLPIFERNNLVCRLNGA